MKSALAALGCFVLAALLALLAVDVARWPGALRSGDVRYRVAPEQQGLWRPAQRIPAGVAGRLLGVNDDLEIRDAVRMVRLGQLEDFVVSDPKLALLRADARARLQAIASGDGRASDRSRALALLGTLSFASAMVEVQDRATHLQEAVRGFSKAIVVDPGNAEAKLNLELALQRGRGLEVGEASGGQNPSPGGAGSQGAGAGRPGSGY
jgi:hypothetical protein